MPGPVTCFEGVQLLRAGHLSARSRPAANAADSAEIAERAYWEIDFPDGATKSAARPAPAGR